MASSTGKTAHTPVHKRTKQGGSKVSRSTMSKHQKRSHKAYRGQGR